MWGGGGEEGRRTSLRETRVWKTLGRLELIPLIKNALVWRCQGHAAVFKASLAPRGPPRPGWMSASAQPAAACPLPDRALANVLLLRVVVIYILSVYINLSAAALAAPLQPACLLRSLGDFPERATHPPAGQRPAPAIRSPGNHNKRLVPSDRARGPVGGVCAGSSAGLDWGDQHETAPAGQRQAAPAGRGTLSG